MKLPRGDWDWEPPPKFAALSLPKALDHCTVCDVPGAGLDRYAWPIVLQADGMFAPASLWREGQSWACGACCLEAWRRDRRA